MKGSRSIRCQDLEEPLAAAGSWEPTKPKGGTGAGCLHSPCSLLVQDHPHADPADLIPCTAPETRFPGEKRPSSQVEGADENRNVSTQSLNSCCLLLPGGQIAFLAAPLWLHSEGFLLSSFCLEDELCPRVNVHASGACRCCPVLPCCETLSVSAGSSLQKMNHICVWRVLVMTHGNLCFPLFTLMVWVDWVYWKKYKIETYACVWAVQNLQLFHVRRCFWFNSRRNTSESVLTDSSPIKVFFRCVLGKKNK